MRLFVLTAVALAPALAILLYNEVSLRRSREAEVHQLAMRFGQLAAQELEGIVGGVEGLLRAVARAPVVRSMDQRCAAYLADIRAQSPSLSGLTVLDLDGRVRCRAEPPLSDQPLGDRQYFKDAATTGGFVIGEYTLSRLSNRAVLPMATPIMSETGTLIGVLAAGLDLGWLGERLRGRDFTRENWEGADLKEIVFEAVQPHCGEERARFEAKGPQVTLPPQMALALGMALHKLCTNAAKDGGFSTKGGRVAIEWSLLKEGMDRRLRLTWRESGGPPVEPPLQRGFGTRLIERGIAREINGSARLDYDPAGVVCTIDAPFPVHDASAPPPLPADEQGEQPMRAAQ